MPTNVDNFRASKRKRTGATPETGLKGWEIMKLGLDLDILLLDTKLNKSSELPFLENFMSYTQDHTGIRDFWNYLYFLRATLKDYYKYKTRCSYEEYMNDKFPPLEKNRPRSKRRRQKSI